MNFKKFQETVKDYKEDITYLYIYYILTIKESLPQKIQTDETTLKMIILLIENTYLYANGNYDLAFICEVATSYIDEIIDDNISAEDLENLCSETLLNC